MIYAKKNSEYFLALPAIDATSPASYNSGITPVADAYSKDGAGIWAALVITDPVTEIGSSGVYEVTISASEMNHDKVLVKFAVAGMADDAYIFDLQDKTVDDLNDITAQDTRDAMQLAPTVDSPAAGSVDLSLDNIEADSNELQLNQGDWATAVDFATETKQDQGLALMDDLAIRKNTSGILHIEMVLEADHVTPAVGLTVTAQRLFDNGSYAAVVGTINEVSNGTYRFNYVAADSNGDTVTWKFSSATADDTKITFMTVE